MSNSELERRARDIGMVYRDEVFAFESEQPEAPEVDQSLIEKEEEGPKTITVTVVPGSSLEDVGEQLQAAGVLEDKEAFLKEVRQQKASKKIIAGDYELTAGMNVKEIVRLLTEGYRQ